MDQYSSYDRVLKLKVRYGTTLFLLCLVFLITIFFLNTNIRNNTSTNNKLNNLEIIASNHLAKYRCFKLQNSNIYRNLIIASINRGNPFSLDSAGIENWRNLNVDLNYDPITGEINSWNTHFANQSEAFDSILRESEMFGSKCEELFSTVSDSSKRLLELGSIVDSFFTNNSVKFYLRKYIIKDLNQIYTSAKWHRIISWIIYEDWPATGGGFGISGPVISYTSRFDDYSSIESKKYHLYLQLLLMTDKDSVEVLLKNEWENSFLNKEKHHLETPKLSIASIGFNIGIDDVLLAVGPVLLFFQILFLIYWQKEKQILVLNKTIEQEFVFPDFKITGGPFSREKYKSSISNFFTNLIWSIFLILPLAILFFGFISRYDIVSIERYPHDPDSLLKTILEYKSTDNISILIDALNLVCLFISITIILFITKRSDFEHEIKYPLKNKPFISAIPFLLISLIVYFLLKLSNNLPEYSFPVSFQNTIIYFLMVLQFIIWIYFAAISLLNKSLFILKTCIAAIVINLLFLLL